ncbi:MULTISPECIES: MFS transporter [Bacillus]|uniref:MFS transporter n=2 Tax=Bacillus TaxID=1386 RepID=A0AAJ4D3K4_9BACI|nr:MULTISPECIES: MFS transporter [Bacillus]KKB73759.1 MFS transporter [Bacillus sp. TH008]MDU0073499.1 MFS transporter [Bacillus sp. IG6]MED8021408.1 MFS transporter [Bacillus glycinifermentans]QAT66508.1 MFS transporter [Bacillus glycinifermentans]WKB76243.1 MFS transporter [Bacillus glycinifermentans]
MNHSDAAERDAKNSIPKYLIITVLTICSIGPQYFLNLSYTLNQIVIQNGLHLTSRDMLMPSILSNLAFALGVPLGRVFSKRYGTRSIYLTFVFVFLCGSLIDVFSTGLISLMAGRTIQGLSAGMLFLTILPVKLVSFPNKIRNLFLFFVISGLFGSSAVGAFFGSLSLSYDAWRWVYVINIIFPVLCLAVGFWTLPKQKPDQREKQPIDKTGVFLLTLLMSVLAFPLIHLQEEGFSSVYVWPFFIGAFILLILFFITDWRAEFPLVPFHSLWSAKSVSGTIMAVASHIALIVALAGINGFLQNIADVSFAYLSWFYIWFFIGILTTAVFSTLLYDRLGAGVLGCIGSLAMIAVGLSWRTVEPEVSMHTLYIHAACLGGGVSMVLVSGALGTALAGDIHKASNRSVSLHFIRNFAGAAAAPVLGWFASMKNAVHYETIRDQVSGADPEIQLELSKLIHRFMNSGLPLGEAKHTAAYTVAANAKKASALGAYHDLFTILLWLGVIMLAASIGKAATGKGRSLVQKKKRLHLPDPNIHQHKEMG